MIPDHPLETNRVHIKCFRKICFELHLYFCFSLKSLDELLERSDSGLEVEPIRRKLRGREAGQAREIPDGES